MRGFTIKEYAGDVSIEWVFNVDENKYMKIETVGSTSSAQEVFIDELEWSIYKAFQCLLENVKEA